MHLVTVGKTRTKEHTVLCDELVYHPIKMALVGIGGLDICYLGLCETEVVAAVLGVDVYVLADNKTRVIRQRTQQNIGSMWLKCLVTVAKIIAANNKLIIGRILAKVEVLPPHQLQCYCCSQAGQVKQ